MEGLPISSLPPVVEAFHLLENVLKQQQQQQHQQGNIRAEWLECINAPIQISSFHVQKIEGKDQIEGGSGSDFSINIKNAILKRCVTEKEGPTSEDVTQWKLVKMSYIEEQASQEDLELFLFYAHMLAKAGISVSRKGTY
jgi:hypothetical protein